MNLTEEQILTLAPDDSSKKSGKELASPAKWSNTGINEKAIWGECQGSGKNPYRTQIDVADIAFKCSCPSRKFPCKHGLGVLLLYSRNKSLFPQGESPEWVKEWIEERGKKAEKKKEKKDKPVDPEEQAKRQQQRLKKVDGGVAEVQLVIKDIVRNGILSMPEKGSALFANLMKRMVDSQAPGLAAIVRELAEMNYYKENWQSEFLDQLLRLYLITAAFQRSDKLSAELQEEIKSQVGFTQSTEELRQQDGIKDQWFVLGRHTEQQDQLQVQRNWLYGTQSGKTALVLQFYVYSQLPEISLTPGTVVEAELSFYKSISPYRAMVKHLGKTGFPGEIKGHGNWNSVLQYERAQYAKSPFVTEVPFLINGVQLATAESAWYLNDAEGTPMRLSMDEKQLYKMLAVSGGKSFDAALIGQEGLYRPLGMFMEGKYIVL